jgi:hypothetical protein
MKSPVIWTVLALGAMRRKVTVPSGLISGDLAVWPPIRDCWAKALTVRAIAAIKIITLFISNVVSFMGIKIQKGPDIPALFQE